MLVSESISLGVTMFGTKRLISSGWMCQSQLLVHNNERVFDCHVIATDTGAARVKVQKHLAGIGRHVESLMLIALFEIRKIWTTSYRYSNRKNMFTDMTYEIARTMKIPVSISNAIPDEHDRLAAVLRDGPDDETVAELRSEEVRLTCEDGCWFLQPYEE